MTETHRRHLGVTIRYIGQLLDEADRLAHAGNGRPDLDAALGEVRSDLRRFGERFDLDLRAPEVDLAHAVRVQLVVASISVSEMRSRSMRAYGELDPGTARDLDNACDELEGALRRAQQVVDRAGA